MMKQSNSSSYSGSPDGLCIIAIFTMSLNSPLRVINAVCYFIITFSRIELFQKGLFIVESKIENVTFFLGEGFYRLIRIHKSGNLSLRFSRISDERIYPILSIGKDDTY